MPRLYFSRITFCTSGFAFGTRSARGRALCVPPETGQQKTRRSRAGDDARLHSDHAQTLAVISRVLPQADRRGSTRFTGYFRGLYDKNDKVAVGCGAAALLSRVRCFCCCCAVFFFPVCCPTLTAQFRRTTLYEYFLIELPVHQQLRAGWVNLAPRPLGVAHQIKTQNSKHQNFTFFYCTPSLFPVPPPAVRSGRWKKAGQPPRSTGRVSKGIPKPIPYIPSTAEVTIVRATCITS